MWVPLLSAATLDMSDPNRDRKLEYYPDVGFVFRPKP